jgi:isocitrate dehydrogenase
MQSLESATRQIESAATTAKTQPATVTLIPGDGIGPEVARATQRLLAAASAPLTWEVCDAGSIAFSKGIASGVPSETLDSIRRNRIVLKGPLETPVGHGGKSANVTLRKMFETYANIRPARELAGVSTPFSGRGIDFVVVRENVEDLYAGIEHMQSPSVAQCLKIITRTGSEKVIRLAFELARAEGRRTVHCATKANIMKLTEGLFKRVFEEIATEYPDIQAKHIIVDNCAHQMAMRPEQFDVVVSTNLNGDILSDLASGLVGGLGFSPSANIGSEVAIFEAVHGSAPDIAGRDLANPTALMLSSVMLLRHLGHLQCAAMIENALLSVIASGEVRTADFGRDCKGTTTAFTDAVIRALGRENSGASARDYRTLKPSAPSATAAAEKVLEKKRELKGMDVFIETTLSPQALADTLQLLTPDSPLALKMISNRGTQVWPATGSLPDLVDVHRCRFVARTGAPALSENDLISLLARIATGLRWVHVERLQAFDGANGYTRAQGEN